jgi:hypothetical protein
MSRVAHAQHYGAKLQGEAILNLVPALCTCHSRGSNRNQQQYEQRYNAHQPKEK